MYKTHKMKLSIERKHVLPITVRTKKFKKMECFVACFLSHGNYNDGMILISENLH